MNKPRSGTASPDQVAARGQVRELIVTSVPFRSTSADIGAPETGPKNEQIGAARPVHPVANGAGAPASTPASAPVGQRDDQTEFSAVFDDLIVPIVAAVMSQIAALAVLRLAADRAPPQPQRPPFIQYGLDWFGRHSCWFAGRRTDVDNGRVAWITALGKLSAEGIGRVWPGRLSRSGGVVVGVVIVTLLSLAITLTTGYFWIFAAGLFAAAVAVSAVAWACRNPALRTNAVTTSTDTTQTGSPTNPPTNTRTASPTNVPTGSNTDPTTQSAAGSPTRGITEPGTNTATNLAVPGDPKPAGPTVYDVELSADAGRLNFLIADHAAYAATVQAAARVAAAQLNRDRQQQ